MKFTQADIAHGYDAKGYNDPGGGGTEVCTDKAKGRNQNQCAKDLQPQFHKAGNGGQHGMPHGLQGMLVNSAYTAEYRGGIGDQQRNANGF